MALCNKSHLSFVRTGIFDVRLDASLFLFGRYHARTDKMRTFLASLQVLTRCLVSATRTQLQDKDHTVQFCTALRGLVRYISTVYTCLTFRV